MNMSKLSGMLLIIFTGASISLSAQITIDQALPVDSVLAFQYLEAPVVHSENHHGVTFPPGGYWTWDAGNGLNTSIEDFNVAWSFTGIVADTLAACLDTMPGQAYRLFNLEEMTSPAAYQDSVVLWLSSLGISVAVESVNNETIQIWPNPGRGKGFYINIPKAGRCEIVVSDMSGKTVRKIATRGDSGQDFFVKGFFNEGLYVVRIRGEDYRYVGKLLIN